MGGLVPVTKTEAQKHSATLGYPWIAQAKTGRWYCFQTEPRVNRVNGYWEAGGNALGVMIGIEYDGQWDESKTGPGRISA